MALKLDAQFLKERQPLILAVVGGLLALYLDLQFLLGPGVAVVTTKQPQVRKLRGEIKQVEQDLQRQATFERSLTELQAKYGRYSTQLLSEQEMPQLYKQLGEMAKQANVKIVSINRKEQTAASGGAALKVGSSFLTRIPIELQARAGYYQAVQLLEQLERSGLLIEVSDLSITGDSQSATQHAVGLTLSMYALKEGLQK